MRKNSQVVIEIPGVLSSAEEVESTYSDNKKNYY